MVDVGLLVPKVDGSNRDAHHSLYWWKHDLQMLGLRIRRQYDTRRTFVTLAQADGAGMDILSWVSHGPKCDVMSMHTTLPWKTLCDEVAKLRIHLPEPTYPAAGLKSLGSPDTVATQSLSKTCDYRQNIVSPTGFEPVLPA